MERGMYDYWGKTDYSSKNYHLAIYHCLDVAAVAYEILSSNELILKRITDLTGWDPDDARNFVTYLCSLHDIGKFTESFQSLNKEVFFEINGRDPNKDIRYAYRHDELGTVVIDIFLGKYLSKSGQFEYYPEISSYLCNHWNILLKASCGHHGIPRDYIDCRSFGSSFYWTDNDETAIKCVATEFCDLIIGNRHLLPHSSKSLSIKDLEKLSWIVSGLTVMSDWIGSNSDYFRFRSEKLSLNEYWNDCAIRQAKHAIEDLLLTDPQISENTGVKALFPIFQSKDVVPSPLQEYVSNVSVDSSPNLYIIEELTGGGKTEAAITLAHKLMNAGCGNGLFFGLPTMATSNAMYGRVSDSYKNMYADSSNPSLILAHSQRSHSKKFMRSLIQNESSVKKLNSENRYEDALCAGWLADNNKKSLLAHVGVGTIDQALVSILPVRYQSLRLFGLFQKVLIVDEVHAYDSYTMDLLKTLMTFMSALGGSVILLSATLPMKMKNELLESFANGANYDAPKSSSRDYPLITHLSKTGFSEVKLSTRPNSERTVNTLLTNDSKAISDEIYTRLGNGECVCWIRNTVADAAETYSEFSKNLPEDKVILFHSRFTLGDRLNIEQKVLKYYGKESTPELRHGMLLIATQVVEQSLDVDFDFMVSDLAPIDALIQRMGRLHRHIREYRAISPIFWIYSPDVSETACIDSNWYSKLLPHSAYVYRKHGDLYLTASLLNKYKKVSSPKDIRNYIEGVYSDEAQCKIPEILKSRDEKSKSEDNTAISLANAAVLKCKLGYTYTKSWSDEEAPSTRLSSPSVTYLLVEKESESNCFKPILHDEDYSLSKVTVPAHLLDVDPKLDCADNSFEIINPDKWCRLLPLKKISDNLWREKYADKSGENKEIEYSSSMGMGVKKS